MAVKDCSHMELKKVYSCSIKLVGSKVMCFLDIGEVDSFRNPKRLSIAMSNLYDLMISFEIEELRYIVGMEIGCLIHNNFKDIQYILPISHEKKKEDIAIRCNQVVLV